MVERRRIDRVSYKADSVIVVREDFKKLYAKVLNLSPLGIAVTVDGDTPSILGKDVIVVADTVIMYADVIREDKSEDGTRTVALSAKKFTNEVLEYLFDRIAPDEDKEQ